MNWIINKRFTFIVLGILIIILVSAPYFITKSKIDKINQLQQQLSNTQQDLQQAKDKQQQDEQVMVQNQAQSSKEDPTIRIESCKTQAKDYADKIAKRDYLFAFQKAMDAGDTATAESYFNLSIKPEHPADYDSNYNSEYVKCLNN